MTLRDSLLLVLLAAIWGSSFLFMRIAGPELGAAPLAWMRVTVAALFLGVLMVSRRETLPFCGRWRNMGLLAFTNTAAPFLLLTYATIHLTAGYGALLNATTPLWGAVIGTLLFGLATGRQMWAGLAVGFLGVGILVAGKLQDVGSAALLPVLAGLLATACYGHAAHYARTGFPGVSALGLAFGSQVLSSVWLLGPALAQWPATTPSSTALACVLVLGVLCTGIAYLIYFGLITRVGSTKATMVTYLAPVFGVSWGALFLSEKLTLAMMAGGTVVLLGVAIAGRAKR